MKVVHKVPKDNLEICIKCYILIVELTGNINQGLTNGVKPFNFNRIYNLFSGYNLKGIMVIICTSH